MTAHAKSASLTLKQLRLGTFQDVCSDCGSAITGATADEVLGASCACHQGYTVEYVTELSCLMCGRAVGTVTTHRKDQRVIVSSDIRCERCGGRPTVGETLTLRRYPQLPRLKLRPGRPARKPKAVA